MTRYSPLDANIARDPYPAYAWLRANAPVYYNEAEKWWALSRYEDVSSALKDHETYDLSRGAALDSDKVDHELPPMLVMLDPPHHTRLRKLVTKHFSPKEVSQFAAVIRSNAQEMIDRLAGAGDIDIVRDFAAPVCERTTLELLEIPAEDRSYFGSRLVTSFTRDPKKPGGSTEADAAVGDMAAYLQQHLAVVTETETSRLGKVLRAGLESGEMQGDEAFGMLLLLTLAGPEDSVRTFANCVACLGRHVDQRRRVVAGPTLVTPAINEILRFAPTTQFLRRTTSREVSLHGQTIPQGACVLLLVASANHDERMFEDPTRFDITRQNAKLNLAFSTGTHACLGIHIAKLQLAILLEEFLAAFPNYELDFDHATHVYALNTAGFQELPARLVRQENFSRGAVHAN